jgi:hypothetical protein
MPANLTTKLGQLVDVLTPDTTNTRIGVANASPTRTLDVTGTGAISTSLAIGGATIGTNAIAVTGTSTFSGNLLVGTTTLRMGLDGANIQVDGGGSTCRLSAATTGNYAVLNLGAGASYLNTAAYIVCDNAANQIKLYSQTATPLLFGINGTEAARLDTSGNFLLGTTTAQARLTVKGATQIIGTGSSTAGGSGPNSGKITKQASSSTSTNSVTVTGTGFSNAAWVNGVIKITAAGGTIYSSNQSGIFAVYSFQGLAGTAPRTFTLMGTAMTAGGTITISFASSSSETLVVTASMSDGNVPGSIPSQNMSMTVEVDYGYPFTLS